MTDSTRRSLLQALSVSAFLPLLSSLASRSFAAQAPSSPTPTGVLPNGHLDVDVSRCHVFPFEHVPMHPTSFGATRPVFAGTLPTGEYIELHETTLNPGQMPHPPHHHRNSELLLVREGTLDFLFADTPGGPLVPHRLTAGGVAFNGSNLEHGMKNVGTIPANYFVVEISHHDPA